jgi:hypothetical protein
MLSESELNALRLACSRALSTYFERAHETCLFILVQKLPLSLEDRAILLLHCRKEKAAREGYESARRNLILAIAGASSVKEI